MKCIPLSSAILLLISTTPLYASSLMVRGFTTLANSDCKSLYVEWNDENRQLEIEFIDHNARTDFRNNIYDVLKRCNIRVELEIPEGYRIAVGSLQVSYDGIAAPETQGYTALRYSFAGAVDEGFSQNLPDEGPIDDTIFYSPSSRRYTQCGDTSTKLDLRSKVWVAIPSDATRDSFVSFENGAGSVSVKNPETKIICGVVQERCGG